jgi:hypothetical protein
LNELRREYEGKIRNLEHQLQHMEQQGRNAGVISIF